MTGGFSGNAFLTQFAAAYQLYHTQRSRTRDRMNRYLGNVREGVFVNFGKGVVGDEKVRVRIP